MQSSLITVMPEETRKFSQVWTYKGLAVPLNEQHLQFATDWANIVLNSFIGQCERRALELVQQREPAPADTKTIDADPWETPEYIGGGSV